MEKRGGRVKAACAGRGVGTSPDAMTDPTDREKRLAEALRQNLRRRKEQARGKDTPSAPEGGDQSGAVA